MFCVCYYDISVTNIPFYLERSVIHIKHKNLHYIKHSFRRRMAIKYPALLVDEVKTCLCILGESINFVFIIIFPSVRLEINRSFDLFTNSCFAVFYIYQSIQLQLFKQLNAYRVIFIITVQERLDLSILCMKRQQLLEVVVVNNIKDN